VRATSQDTGAERLARRCRVGLQAGCESTDEGLRGVVASEVLERR
jgi:hypothetical protein